VNDAWRLPAWLGRTGGAIGDHVLVVLIVIVAVLAWSPLVGLAAARETLAAGRDRRSRLAGIDSTQSPVWARQARRNALGWQRQAEPMRRRSDP
jgi:hypothetical protein